MNFGLGEILTLGMAAVAAAGAHAAGLPPNMLENPGFELPGAGADTAADWQLNAPRFRRMAGEGRNGSCGLVCDASEKGQPGRTTNQRLRVRPGARYRIETWVRCENLESGPHGASMCIDWCDEKGKFLGEQYPVGVRGTEREWQRLSIVLQRMPETAAFVSLMPAVDAGKSGRAAFDDFRMCEEIPQAVPAIVSDVYRDTAAGGSVTFTAALDLKSVGVELAQTEGMFSYVKADGGRAKVKPDRLVADRATLTVPVDSLVMDAQTVAFRLTDRKGTKLGDAGLRFVRQPVKAGRRVEIDRFGRTLVGGKPFFPLGFFSGGLSQGQMRKYWKGTPFNCIMPYSLPTVADLDCAEEHGFKVLVSLKDLHCRTMHCPAEVRCEADETNFVARVVNEFKAHPALLAWYVNDESDVGMIPRLAKRRRLLERLDPEHPTWGCIYQLSEAAAYVPTTDVQGSDPYVIPGDISKVLESTLTIREASRGNRPLWQVPQVFDWSAYHNPPHEGERAPTEEEMRNMSWQCIAGGANGLVYYCYNALWQMDKKDPFERRWREWRAVAEEIRSRFPMLLAEPSPLVVRDAPAKLGWRAWKLDGRTMLLLVNSTREALTAKIRLSHACESAVTTWGEGVTRSADGSLSVALKPLGVAIVEMQNDGRCGIISGVSNQTLQGREY